MWIFSKMHRKEDEPLLDKSLVMIDPLTGNTFRTNVEELERTREKLFNECVAFADKEV